MTPRVAVDDTTSATGVARHLTPRRLVIAALVVFCAMHLHRLNDPPQGQHEWRESSTASVTINFYQEDMRPWLPRVHDRGDGTGILGSELPLYNYLGALIYFVTGPSHVVLHLLTILSGLLAIWMVFLVGSETLSAWAGAFAAWGTAFSPLLFFYSFKMIPDLLLVALAVTGLYAYLRFHHTGRLIWLVAAAAALIASGAIKPHGLAVLLPIAWLSLRPHASRLRRIALTIGLITAAVLLPYCWFEYGLWLCRHYGNCFAIDLHLKEAPALITSGLYFKVFFQVWPVEIWVGWLFAPAWLWGAWRAFRSRQGVVFLLWILACYIGFLINVFKSSSHDYYTLIAVPAFAAFTGIGLASLWHRRRWLQYLIIVLLVLSPVWAYYRVSHRFGSNEAFAPARRDAERLLPKDELVMIEDHTTVDHLYQLNRYGWAVRGKVQYEEVASHIHQGARYLLLMQPLSHYDDRLPGLLAVDAAFRIGTYFCYPVETTPVETRNNDASDG